MGVTRKLLKKQFKLFNNFRQYTCGDDGLLNLKNINKYVIKMEYAILGPIVMKARQLDEELKEGVKHPFSQIIYANIGDSQAMGQKPITYVRQILATILHPQLLDSDLIPEDVKSKAKFLLKFMDGHSIGSYTDPAGNHTIKECISKFIERRDGHPSLVDDIFLCAGATEGIIGLLRMFALTLDGKKAGIMVPIPMYPLYSAAVVQFNMHQIGYYLDESQNWGLDIEELERAIFEAKKVCYPRAIVVINPSNPTSGILTRKNIENVIKFAYRHKLFLFADEVYQENVYGHIPFISFKKVAYDLGEPYNQMEICSMMSTSKGSTGECGLRGGYVEICNLSPEARKCYKTHLATTICPNTIGQATMYCVVDPPKKVGEPSYVLHKKERQTILDSLKKRGEMLYEAFSKAEGFNCNPTIAAMYAYPSIILPPKAIREAEKLGQHPDVFYVSKLLEETGICVIPGSGFGQKPGTYHFRTTILPEEHLLEIMVEKFKEFHVKFIKEYS